MISNVQSITGLKQRRIMIITADENIIDQIEKNNNTLLLEQIVRESEANNNKTTNQQVGNTLFSYRQTIYYVYRPKYNHHLRRIKLTMIL
jgi:hypothetical protein